MERDAVPPRAGPDGSEVRSEVLSQHRVFDGFFKIDEITYRHRLMDGAMSPPKTRLVFERGHAVGILVYDRDRERVVAVEEFKVPTRGKGRGGGYIIETIAGMIRDGETPEVAACREAMEEIGYRIEVADLHQLGRFFSSPGGSSELIYLYFASATSAQRVAPGGGIRSEGEDIRVVELTPEDLFARLDASEIEDPKLIIAGRHLRELLKLAPRLNQPLSPGEIEFERSVNPRQKLVITLGDIKLVRDIDVWVNSENTDMMMDRVIGRSISANIRYLGAEKDFDGRLIEDTIADNLRKKLGGRGFVRLGTIVDTAPGALGEHGVKRIVHVATAESRGPGQGFRVQPETVEDVVARALAHVERANGGLRLFASRRRSILLPMIGTGDGGLTPELVAPRIVAAVARFMEGRPKAHLTAIHVLAYTARDRLALETAIEGHGSFARKGSTRHAPP